MVVAQELLAQKIKQLGSFTVSPAVISEFFPVHHKSAEQILDEINILLRHVRGCTCKEVKVESSPSFEQQLAAFCQQNGFVHTMGEHGEHCFFSKIQQPVAGLMLAGSNLH